MGFAVQTNVVRENGKRSALLTVIKNGDTSTLDIVSQTKAMIPQLKAGLGNLTITPLFDQSIFVRDSISEVVREATIAALLTGLMILLFLGSWRSTLIVCVSIPLSIATSLVILTALGESINVMTLGGMALAVGILVDDATVEIENTHRNMAEKKAADAGDSGFGTTGGGTGVCIDDGDLYCVYPGGAADGCSEVFVYAAGAGCGVCDDG